MGLWVSKLVSYFGDKEARILVLGLDNAGKTTILCTFTASTVKHN
jgi:ADP-ribosylation factor-like protein 1